MVKIILIASGIWATLWVVGFVVAIKRHPLGLRGFYIDPRFREDHEWRHEQWRWLRNRALRSWFNELTGFGPVDHAALRWLKYGGPAPVAERVTGDELPSSQTEDESTRHNRVKSHFARV
jgi:hypothetical protein